MKKNLLLFLSLSFLLFAFAACNNAAVSPKDGEARAKASDHYKSAMLPLDQLVPSERLVILQNVFNSNTREGFFTRETRPSAVEIEYNGNKAQAYPMSHAVEFLRKGAAGTVAVTKADGGKAEFSADDFRGMYVIFESGTDTPPVLYNPATKSAVADFAYAVTGEGEAIYSVVSGAYQNVNEMLVNVGWKTDAAYRFVATDKFYVPVDPAAAATGELRGGLSGVVNGSFPDLSFASGKINDVLYIELIVE
jgi:hypothetical protein